MSKIDMMNPTREFQLDPVTHLTAHARGVPGKRTFYVDVADGQTHARVWLEKEELQALGLAIERLVAQLAFEHEPSEGEVHEAAQELGDAPTAEFKAGKLSLGFDQGRNLAVLTLEGTQEGQQRPTTVHCWAPLGQMVALCERIARVCAAGRPLCPLCHAPIDPEGHRCLRANGHRATTQL
jgi:uncharacterized repeat protein (TIGR03847 family)